MKKKKVNNNSFVSIIIPLYVVCDRFFEDLKKYEKLSYHNYEILVIHDNIHLTQKKKFFKVKFISTKKDKTGPAEKRDYALTFAKGDICAFIDDDAYPHPNWLTEAIKLFDEGIDVIGGPGLTPPEDGFWEQITGLVYSSIFCGGAAQYRFIRKTRRYVVDFPAYNLLVKTNVLKQVGGYDSYFYGGEDTFLCYKLVKQGHKILYDPDVIVYHHRRKLFFDYFSQIANIGKHRGYFVKKFPETSFHFWYFLPSLLLLGFIGGILLSFLYKQFAIVFLSLLIFFYFLAVSSVIQKKYIVHAFIAGFGIILTHLVYGFKFLVGLLTSKMIR